MGRRTRNERSRRISGCLIFLVACELQGQESAQSDTTNADNARLHGPWRVPECSGEMASVKLRGRTTAEVLEEPSGILACATPSPHGYFQQYFLAQSVGCPYSLHDADTCRSDEDCEFGMMCLCSGYVEPDVPGGVWDEMLAPFGKQQFEGKNHCVKRNCPEDCGGLGCALVRHECGWTTGFRCYTEDDECGGLNGLCDVNRDEICTFSDDENRWICLGRADCD